MTERPLNPFNSITDEKREEFINELGNALLHLSDVFAKHEATLASVSLSSFEDGLVMKSMLPLNHLTIYPVMDDKDGPMMQCEIAGILVRWPAQLRALYPDGKIRRYE